jgi:SHS2 domain-containing protein
LENYRFLHHTADAKFQAFGQTLEEAFSNAALAIASLMWDQRRIRKRLKVPIEVKGRDLAQLLVNFLEEILFLLDTKGFLLSSVEELSIQKNGGAYSLRACFIGDEYSSLYEIFGDVKAITYNEMFIKKKAPFMVQVVADI